MGDVQEAINSIKELLENEQAFNDFVEERFAHTDKDKNGVVDAKELEAALVEISSESGAPNPSKEEVQKILDKFDYDRNGKIDKKEFSGFCKFVLQQFLQNFQA